jgi:hypothetical protein
VVVLSAVAGVTTVIEQEGHCLEFRQVN